MYEQTMNNDLTMTGSENPLLAGRYRVVRRLGTGGMGSVWLAEDRQLDGKLFAIKMLPSILVSNKRAYRQLKDEALVAMRLVHPNIVQIRAFEENNGNPFLVMDYVEGETLDDYFAEKGKLSEDETLRILKPIAAALDYAHGEGVVHRDVKPANVMIRKDGHPYILDFGIAREIQETMTCVTGKLSSGTLLYMSPEQLRGQPPKAAQDVYSFAAMVYECLKGEPPFSRGQIEYQILNEKPEPLPAGVKLSASIMRGLSKTPESRPDSCVKVLHTAPSMKQMPPVRPQIAVPPRPAAPMADRIVVRRKLNIAGSVALFCLVGSLFLIFCGGRGGLWLEKQREESRLHRAENERKAQEAAARKKAETEHLAKLKHEEAQRKIVAIAEQPKIYLTATLDGVPKAALITSGMAENNKYTTPLKVNVVVSLGSKIEFSAEYFENNVRYVGKAEYTAQKGLQNVNIILSRRRPATINFCPYCANSLKKFDRIGAKCPFCGKGLQ